MTSTSHELAVRMAELARDTALPRNVDEVLAGVTAAAVEMIPGTDTCGVLLIGKGGKFSSLYGTSDSSTSSMRCRSSTAKGPASVRPSTS